MAEMEDSELSLMSLEEELTCCICLSLFDCPVTIPCGHNFCQDCLLSTWKDSYSCPQCRTHFSTKPELKKNTVLSTVVQTFNQRKCKSEASLEVEEPKAEKQHVIRCDTCMEAEAAQTCLTCMASFCEEHLRPHRDNPRFSVHQLSAPVGDLSERICPDHHKLMELFCSQHERPICSLCLQQGHKGCSFMSPEEQRTLKESDLRGKLSLLDKQITKNEDVIFQANGLEKKLKDSATNKKASLAAHYQQMRDMLAREERDALNAVDCELESGETKLKNFSKKLAGNITSMSKAKEYIQTLLSQTQSLAFLQASVNLPQAATFDPFCPRMNLDSKKVKTSQEFAAVLKAHLTKILTQPVENRLPLLKVEKAAPDSASSGSTGSQPEPEVTKPPKQKKAPNNPPNPPPYRPVPVPGYQSATGWKPLHPPGYMGPQFGGPPMRPGPGPQPKTGPKKKPQKQKPPHATEDNVGEKNLGRSMDNLMEFGGKDKPKGCNPESKEKPKGCNPESKEASGKQAPSVESVDIPPDITTAEKRTELLKYATVLTMDPKTAHKRITLSDSFTKATVSDEHTNYPDCPERFAICSQVLASKGFSRGRHYWEVRLSSNNFIGVGLAYSSIDRKGPMSRLGRNAQSWCIEWFNVKLSAWHNSNETVLVNPNPKRVGVLLDCEEGTATFYNVADRAYPFHTFVFPFAEAVYPAFWIFSNGLSVSLCKLT